MLESLVSRGGARVYNLKWSKKKLKKKIWSPKLKKNKNKK
jgi:hypothetical protein